MKYYITDADGNRIPAEGGGHIQENEILTADTTLTVEDSGKTFFLDATGEVITLPSTLVAGVNYTFKVIAAVATSDWTIVSATDVIEGYAVVNYATVAASNENTISLVAAAAIVGDEVKVICDGTSWQASGLGSSAGSITFTAP